MRNGGHVTINGHAIAGGLITALAGDYRICVRAGAKLGLNEVPVGIAMPSIYIELIRYACGNGFTALSTLFGELYEPDRANLLGFVHELAEPEALIKKAILRASTISDQAIDAYADSKRSLLAPTLRRIEQISQVRDHQLTRRAVSERSKAANAEAMHRLKK